MKNPISAAKAKKSNHRGIKKTLAIRVDGELHDDFHDIAKQSGSCAAVVLRELVEAYCDPVV